MKNKTGKSINEASNKHSKLKGKLNPFEIHINHSKHTIIGQKSKDDHGLPGVSRGKAYRKREKTLLKEYQSRFKSGKFLDLRIGEKSKFLDPEKKIMMRMAAEKKKQFSKKSLYNLNDDEQLTHKGEALNEFTMQDDSAFSDEDNEDDLLDADFVKEQHFGGDIFTKRKFDDKNSKIKNRKDWIDDIIAESKKKKAETKKEKEVHNDAVSKLDAKFQHFLSLMKGKGMTEEDKEKSKKTCEFREFDTFVRELAFDRSKRARPTDRLKTEEELVKEEQEKLLKLEEERQKRMRGEIEGNPKSFISADALHDWWEPMAKNPSNANESREEEIDFKGSLKGYLKRGLKTYNDCEESLNVASEDGEENESEDEAEGSEAEESFEHSGNETNNSGESSSNAEDESENSSAHVESDSYQNSDEESDTIDKFNGDVDGAIATSSEASDDSDDGIESEHEQEHERTTKIFSTTPNQNKDGIKNNECKTKTKDEENVGEELPYTFEVPPDFDGFWDLLQDRTPSQVSTIVERMITCNHPSLGANNKENANTIFAYLLQTLHIICAVDPEFIWDELHPLCYIDVLIPHLYTLTQLNPPDCASALSQVIDEKYEECTSKGKSHEYPFADTYIFLKVAGILFPASDYHHDVMTRVITFLTQILGEKKVNCGRDLAALLFTSSLLFEYLNRSNRFVGELTNALHGLLYLSIQPSDSKLSLPLTHPFRAIGPSSQLLVLDHQCEKFFPPRLTLALLNETTVMNDNFKIKVLNESLTLLNKLSHKWTNLSAVKAIFSPTIKLLENLSLQKYPMETKDLVLQLQSSLSNMPRQVPHLFKEDARITSLRMLEPAIEEVIDGIKKRGGSKQMQEKNKLLHKLKRERKGAKRELKRDAEFIARQQLKEVLQSDAERKRKVNLIMQGLSTQESEYKKFKNSK